MQDLAADFGPRQPHGRADLVLLLGCQVAELPGAQQLRQLLAGDHAPWRSCFLSLPLCAVHHLARHFAADVADLALQVADAGFPRVVLDQPVDRPNPRTRSGPCETPGRFHLLAHQEPLGDLHLLQFGIAGEPDHFHAVLQGRRNGVENVGRGDEEDLAQIVLHIQVVVNEHEILFGVEHFEQRGRRIAAEIHRHLVHFVQHEDRVARARPSSSSG